MTIFKYRGVPHPVNEVNLVRMHKRKTHTKRGHQKRDIHTLTIVGELKTTTDGSFDTLLAALEDQYEEDGRFGESAGLYWDDGEPTPHVITANNQCVNGIEVLDFSYTGRDGAELATQRTFQITLKAEFFALSGTSYGSGLMEWYEEIKVKGNGGPIIRWTTTETGAQAMQITQETSGSMATQTGYAVMARGPYILPPPPRWPLFNLNNEEEIGHGSAQRQEIAVVDYRTTWRYKFKAPVALSRLEYPQTR